MCTKLAFEYYRIAGTEGANKVWMRDLKSVANIPMPRPGVKLLPAKSIYRKLVFSGSEVLDFKILDCNE